VQPQLGEHEHHFWARSAGDAARIPELYVSEPGTQQVTLPVDPAYYDYPVMVTPIRDTGWGVVHMIQGERCASLSANRIWRAHDFSIIGQDVSKGQTVTCRAWMAYVKLDALDDALGLYQELSKEAQGL
jgi:hypothetical protein